MVDFIKVWHVLHECIPACHVLLSMCLESVMVCRLKANVFIFCLESVMVCRLKANVFIFCLAADDDELTFDPDDIITDIEMVCICVSVCAFVCLCVCGAVWCVYMPT